MDDPNMTMEEYIKLEEEKARRRGRVFNWRTSTYGKIRIDDDLHDLRSVKAEFPAIVINDAFAPQDALPCKSQGLEYTDVDIADFEERWRGFTVGRYTRRRLSWRQFILALGLHTGEEVESLSFARYWSESERMIPEKGSLHDYYRRLDVGSVNIPYLLARYLRRFAAGRKSGAHISGGQFVSRLAEHFGLLTAEILRGLTAPPPPPAAARTMPQRMARLAKDVHEIRGALTDQHEVIDTMARDFSRFSTWAVTGLVRMMDRAGDSTCLVIMEYLVNICKRRAFWSLNEDILKITILTTNTPYPLRKIRRIRACTHQRPQRNEAQYAVSRRSQYATLKIMDDPNVTMEEYIKLEEQKAHRRDRVFNWRTTTYGNIMIDDDLHDLRSVEAEFLAIVINDAFAHHDALLCKSQGFEYTAADIANFEERLEMIYSWEIHRVQVVDFLGMPELMRDGLFARMVMEHHDDTDVVVFTSRAWGRVFDNRGPLLGGVETDIQKKDKNEAKQTKPSTEWKE
ncbi:hypothetical protein Tco_0622024 [Tanacetum coccineum]